MTSSTSSHIPVLATMTNRLTRGDRRTRSATHPVGAPEVRTLPRAVPRRQPVVYEENPMDGQSAPTPGVALVVSLLRLRCGDEQHPAFIGERGAEHHLPTVIVMRSGVRNEHGGSVRRRARSSPSGQSCPRPGSRCRSEPPGGASRATTRTTRCPGWSSALSSVSRVALKTTSPALFTCELPAGDIAGGHECVLRLASDRQGPPPEMVSPPECRYTPVTCLAAGG